MNKWAPLNRLAKVRNLIQDLVADLESIGFGDDPDEPVNGGDCVEVIGRYIDQLKAEAKHPN